MAISMKDLKSVHLKKTENAGQVSRGAKQEKKPDPMKDLLKNSKKGKICSIIHHC